MNAAPAASAPRLKSQTRPTVAIVGAGPAGLFAAEQLAPVADVTVYERMPSPLRKFLLAGRGGLNLTHAEPLDRFIDRYGAARPALEEAIRAFPPGSLRAWAAALGEETFVGSSGRVFPKSFKATPLARAWLQRLDALGVRFAFRHRWSGWADGNLAFETAHGPVRIRVDATLLALGGASWPRLGSDGSWQAPLAEHGIAIAPLTASNAGMGVAWSEVFTTGHAGAPLKGMAFTVGTATSRAEAVITRSGLEGGAIYALSEPMRTALAASDARLMIDLKPDVDIAALEKRLAIAGRGQSLSNVLRKAGLSPAAIGLLREAAGNDLPRTPHALAARIKALSLPVRGMASIDRAISTAGGVRFTGLGVGQRVASPQNVWLAGEMLDWDAPTGGYLLQASFATGFTAARSIAAHLVENKAFIRKSRIDTSAR